MYFKARDGDAVQSKAAMIATGVNKQGYRRQRIGGILAGDLSLVETTWS